MLLKPIIRYLFFRPDLLLGLVLTLAVILPLGLAMEYKLALPGYHFQFPRDHAAHPAFKTEWWYYTGHLESSAGKRYGYELTFFRIGTGTEPTKASKTAWDTGNLYAAHFALTDEAGRRFSYTEKLSRAGIKAAGARTDQFEVWNELWLAELLGRQMILRADNPETGQEIHLLLSPQKPPVVHGQNGVSQKASCTGCASHYYSMTRLETAGTLILGDQAIPVHGLSWMDHEFGSNQLGKNQTGWDWFSLQLSDGSDLMLYVLRTAEGGIDPNSSGTVVAPNGKSRHLKLSDFHIQTSGRTWKSPKTGGVYPMGWQIALPSEHLELTVTPAFEEQELSTTASTGVSYWEGSSTVTGRRNGHPLTGQAYVEMTGYAHHFRSKI